MSDLDASPIVSYDSRCTRWLSLTSVITSCSKLTSYAMEFPRRFRQDIVKAASSSRQYNAQATVSADGIESVLQNIGAGNRMSRSEIDEILNEVGVCPVNGGNAQCVISASQMIDLISKHWTWCDEKTYSCCTFIMGSKGCWALDAVLRAT